MCVGGREGEGGAGFRDEAENVMEEKEKVIHDVYAQK